MSMLLYWPVLQSSGGVFWLLKIFCVFVLDLFLYSCLYLDMTFLTQSRVYFVVIVWAWVFCVLAIFAIVMKHSCWRSFWFGGWYVDMFTIFKFFLL